MKKFEYKITSETMSKSLFKSDPSDKVLKDHNELGAAGWELVAVTHGVVFGAARQDVIFYWKREIT